MAKKPLPLRIDADLLRRVDERRGVLGQTRTLFVERALESALRAADGMKAPGSVLPHGGQSSSAPSRASVKRPTAPVLPAPFPLTAGNAPKMPPGVRTAREIAQERQAALNKAKKT